MYDFTLVNCDTDAITINKKDGSSFKKEELEKLTKELNSLYPQHIKWEFEFNIPKMIILKAKNYILKSENGKITYKGSSLKSSKIEPALKMFLYDIINEILNETYNYIDVYNRYVQEILHITDMTPWCTKKTLTEKVLEGTRANETKVMDAIKGTEYVEGDKFYVFYMPDKSLCLLENFKGEYDKSKLLKRLYDTIKIFDNIIDISVFPNYNLKRNKGLLNLE